MAQVNDRCPSDSILISMKPPYARAILEGSKTIELRRRFSENLPIGSKMLIYATTPQKEVIGECEIKKVHKLPLDKLWEKSCRDAMINWETFILYFDGLNEGYGIEVCKPFMYEKPIPLNELI